MSVFLRCMWHWGLVLRVARMLLRNCLCQIAQTFPAAKSPHPLHGQFPVTNVNQMNEAADAASKASAKAT